MESLNYLQDHLSVNQDLQKAYIACYEFHHKKVHGLWELIAQEGRDQERELHCEVKMTEFREKFRELRDRQKILQRKV